MSIREFETMYGNTLITAEQAAQRYPILANPPHSSRSERYGHIPTIEIVKALEKEGFQLRDVQTARVRDGSKAGFQKHLVRFQRPQSLLTKVDDVIPEIIGVNAHDGSAAWHLYSGFLRLWCLNGAVTGGGDWGEFTITHRGKKGLIDNVIEASYEIVKDFDKIGASIENLRSVELKPDEITEFTRAAVALRYGDSDRLPVSPEHFGRVRRSADNGNNLWVVYNRLQEGLVRGGQRGYDVEKHRRTRVREIKGIDSNIKINRSLWALTEQFAKDRQPIPRERALVAA
jgi:hypothetical protein